MTIRENRGGKGANGGAEGEALNLCSSLRWIGL